MTVVQHRVLTIGPWSATASGFCLSILSLLSLHQTIKNCCLSFNLERCFRLLHMYLSIRQKTNGLISYHNGRLEVWGAQHLDLALWTCLTSPSCLLHWGRLTQAKVTIPRITLNCHQNQNQIHASWSLQWTGFHWNLLGCIVSRYWAIEGIYRVIFSLVPP